MHQVMDCSVEAGERAERVIVAIIVVILMRRGVTCVLRKPCACQFKQVSEQSAQLLSCGRAYIVVELYAAQTKYTQR